MARTLISSGSDFERVAGYSRAVVDGRWVFVSGTTGFDYAAGTIADSVEEQTHQTFRNIAAALEKAGAGLKDVVRIRVYLSESTDFPKVAPILGEYMGEVRPANTTVVCQLVDPRMKVEIEVTARR
ncbi:RidA family protein [Azospirillum sp. RWY-5-1]|uniref:RidA family protein n=1 Tax=Azospirillum oleiclasticum TaxID=2735135 RepID=A0ABX2TL81_9PROT|nr:RidA family protein [Azospirillum oleiclasticum]NYZ16791.1 RidA family protein [Azospirillum oleiclasticum]NYZ24475.1 RidA family protein [Azospirillum oleiclasticum]